MLPVIPDTGQTRKLPIRGHAIFVEVAMRADGYRLLVFDQHKGEMRKRFGADGLSSKEEVNLIWQEFLDEKNSIFADPQI